MGKKKIIITGGTGFIGRNLVEILSSNYEILAPGHSELPLENAGQVLAWLAAHPSDVVIHAANRGGNRGEVPQPDLAEQNLRLFFNIIRAKQHFKRLIMLGSGAEYDKRQALVKVKESDFDSSVPGDSYGFYKSICARYATAVDYITHIRLFGVFGKYEDYTIRFISNAIGQALLGLPIIIKQNVVFDYLWINDLARIMAEIIERPPRQKCLNVASGQAVDLLSIAKIIAEHLTPRPEIIVKNNGLGQEYTADITALQTYYPAAHFTPLGEAIGELVEYYRINPPTLQSDTLTRNI